MLTNCERVSKSHDLEPRVEVLYWRPQNSAKRKMKHTSLILLFALSGFGQSFTVSRADDDVQRTKRVEIRTYSSDRHYFLQVACNMSTAKQSKTSKLFVGDSNSLPTNLEVHSDSRLRTFFALGLLRIGIGIPDQRLDLQISRFHRLCCFFS
jgi:hypothetical protein